ncbi:hypothetical protein ACFE04_029434 [Oxalis oulophora]
MRISIFSCLSLLISCLLFTPSFADKKSYIVYLGAHTHGAEPTDADLDLATNSHYELLGSTLGSKEKAQEQIFYSYNRNINGFAAMLEEEEAADIAKNPNVVSVFLNKRRQLHTTRSWEFLGLENSEGNVHSHSIWKKARFGEDVIIGNLDTGVWPESESFSDEGLGPVPTRWRGICQKGYKDGFRCNRKLIGARYFNKGYAASVGGNLSLTANTARDHDGHGTHTLSTAGGSFVRGANVFGYGNGTAKGGSPKARVAAYKVCWPAGEEGGCFDADIMSAFEAAIHDRVDILSVSLGGDSSEYFEDGIAIGSFHAVQKGISVVLSAGNSGPQSYTVSNSAPWMITVAASTIDREFVSYVSLGRNRLHGRNVHLKGSSLSTGELPDEKFYPLITGAAAKANNASEVDAPTCQANTLDPEKVKGKILVCTRGVNARVDKSYQALLAGAVGMILANDESSGNELIADPHFLPTSHITFDDGQILFKYINSTKNPLAYITKTKTLLNTKPAPSMAAFSSRGPNTVEPSILKPDITAPGVTIIASFSQSVGPTGQAYDKRRIPFVTESGTSMSCPHVSGIVGLLKTLYPKWSPAAIHSALMTSASIESNAHEAILDSDKLSATPFTYGAGHVSPNSAMDPGLVYDMDTNDYLNFLCAHGYDSKTLKTFTSKPYSCPTSVSLNDINYPSISIPLLNSTSVVTRRLKNVGRPGTYNASVVAPEGVSVSVVPETLKFEKVGQEIAFTVMFKTEKGAGTGYFLSGWLTWSDGMHRVRSPITVQNRF